MPHLDRGEVAIGDGVLVVEVQEYSGSSKTSDEYIWLFGNGTVEAERVVVTSEASKPSVEKQDLDTSTKSGKAGVEVANIAKKGSTAGTYLKADGSETINPDEAGTEAKATKADIEKGKTQFSFGTGTKNNPWGIKCEEDLDYICRNLTTDMENCKPYYFKVIKDFSVVNGGGLDALCGEFDGQSHTITILDESISVCLLGNIHGEAYIHDLTVAYGKTVRSIVNLASNSNNPRIDNFDNVIFENITLRNADGYAITKGVGYPNYGCFGTYVQNAKFINCINEANIDFGTTYAGILIGGYTISGQKSRISFINCFNKGVVTGTSAGFFTGSPNQASNNYALSLKSDFSDVTDKESAVYVENCGNFGTLKGTYGAGAFAVTNTSSEHKTNIVNLNNTIINNGSFKKGTIVDGSSTKVALKVENNEVSLQTPATGAEHYSLVCYITLSYDSGSGYFQIIKEDLPADFKEAYISKAINDKLYQTKYGKSFNQIAGDVLYGLAGYEYKLVELEDGSYMAVFNATKDIAAHGIVHDVETSTTYLINAYNSDGESIATEVYASGSVKK